MLEAIQQRLANHRPPHNPHIQQCASVLIPLFEKEDGLHVLLTRRSQELRSHSGQVSFPGGRQDETDKNAWETALRESMEEIGLDRSQVHYLGELDQIISANFLLVTPFVGVIPADFQPAPNAFEIESVFSVPLTFFMDENHHTSKVRHYRARILSHHFHFKDYDIWGLTALLILRLLEVGLDYIPSYPIHLSGTPSWMEFSQNFREDQIETLKQDWGRRPD